MSLVSEGAFMQSRRGASHAGIAGGSIEGFAAGYGLTASTPLVSSRFSMNPTTSA